MKTFRQKLGEIRETDKSNQDKLSRLIDDLQTEKDRFERGLRRCEAKADKLLQLENDLVEKDKQVTKELDEAETESEREHLRGFRAGLNLALERVRAIGGAL